jgi:hypothetical protein
VLIPSYLEFCCNYVVVVVVVVVAAAAAAAAAAVPVGRWAHFSITQEKTSSRSSEQGTQTFL